MDDHCNRQSTFSDLFEIRGVFFSLLGQVYISIGPYLCLINNEKSRVTCDLNRAQPLCAVMVSEDCVTLGVGYFNRKNKNAFQ